MRSHIPQRHIAVMPGNARCRFGTIALCLLICLTLALGGCRQKDLVFPNEGLCRIDIRFLWNNAVNASPEGMTLLFYPLEEDSEFWRFEISGCEGGTVEMPEGSYTMIAVNNDLPGVSLTTMPYEAASLNVRDVPRSQTYASPTGMVYMGRIDKVEISSREVNCYPDSISTLFHVVADSINGMERVRSASAVIEGLASGVSLFTLKPFESTVAVAFDLATDKDSASFTGFTSGFLSDPSSASYMLTLRVGYNGGGAYEKTFDVTEQVINYFYQHNVYIIIRGLILPEEPTIKPDEVGIKVDVDGWRVVDINIDSTDY